MYIKNYSTTDFKVKINDDILILPADTITYVNSNLVTLAQLKNMFGSYIEEITDVAITASIPETYLRNCETLIELNKLYAIKAKTLFKVVPNIFINAGTVNIYVYKGSSEPTSQNDMVLENSATNVSGLEEFSIVPDYIYITQNTGTTTELVLSYLDILSENIFV